MKIGMNDPDSRDERIHRLAIAAGVVAMCLVFAAAVAYKALAAGDIAVALLGSLALIGLGGFGAFILANAK